MDSRFQEIEASFIARRARRPDLGGALADAIRHVGAQAGAHVGGLHAGTMGALLQAGGATAAAMDAWCGNQPELAYHNRHHAAEAALAMGWLCALALGWGLLSPVQALAGVVAMLGHDMLHDGTPGGDGALEARSSAAAAALAATAGLDASSNTILADVILATNPVLAASNAARAAGLLPAGPLGRSHDLLRCLANEADICASLLPRLGPRLGQALEREWRMRGVAGLPGVGTHAGRLAFLRSVPLLSRPASVVGLESGRAASIAVYAAAGAALRGEATAEAGSAALDQAGPAAARVAYAAAVRACAPATGPRPGPQDTAAAAP